MINLTRDLASQWARRGVRVNAIAPGWFESEMSAPLFESEERWQRYLERTVPMGRVGREGELDGALLFLAGDASAYVTGQTLVLDGGAGALSDRPSRRVSTKLSAVQSRLGQWLHST